MGLRYAWNGRSFGQPYFIIVDEVGPVRV